MTGQLTREDIAEMLAALEETSAEVGKVVEAISSQDRRARIVSVVGAVLAAAVVVLGGLQLTSRSLIRTIEDCTRVGGGCYAESQKRTASIVGPIGEKLERIEERGDANRQLLCLGIPDTRRPADICPPEFTTSTTSPGSG